MNTKAVSAGCRLALGLIALAAGLAVRASAQNMDKREFAAASVKPSQAGRAGGEGSEEKLTISPASVTLRSATLRSCLRWAYGVRESQISGPGWLATQRFDIAAKSQAPASVNEMKQMMQTLLADRFQLRLHREQKEQPVYSMLLVGKNSKLRPAAVDADTGMVPDGGSLVFRNYTMAQLADRLADRPFRLDRIVIDRTGLDGSFDFALKFAENGGELKHALEGMEQGSADAGASMFTILREQLGLTFKGQKAPIESLVVDEADRLPAAN